MAFCMPSVAVSAFVPGRWKITRADSRQVVTGGWGRTVRLWDVANGNPLATLTGHEADVWAVASSPMQPIAVSVGEDRTVRV